MSCVNKLSMSVLPNFLDFGDTGRGTLVCRLKRQRPNLKKKQFYTEKNGLIHCPNRKITFTRRSLPFVRTSDRWNCILSRARNEDPARKTVSPIMVTSYQH